MKKIGKLVGILILIILLLPAVLPSQFSMSRSIEIDAPVGTVFTKLTDLNEYIKWNPFPEGDPTNTAQVSGVGVGSFLIWKGDKTGEGKMTITSIEPEQKIGIKMDFYKPMSGEGMVFWITQAKSDTKTEMTWTFDQDLPYFNRYFGLFMDGMMGKHFEKGLSNYKSLIEASK
ncbi:MAG: SRPBCC family protein [Bdellovibrionota bacterium]